MPSFPPVRRTGAIALARASLFTLVSCLAVAPALRADEISDLAALVSRDEIAARIAALEGERTTFEQRQAAADAIETALESYGYTVARELFSGGSNLIAWLRGDSQERLVVLGAHYDTVAGTPGADDDASGVAAVLELARVLAGHPRSNTIEFAFFDRGEPMREGSLQHAFTLSSAEREVLGMISLDSIGFRCTTPGCQMPIADVPEAGCFTSTAAGVDVGDFVEVIGNAASQTQLQAFAAAAATYVPALRVEESNVAADGSCAERTRESDQASFWDAELPGLLASDTWSLRNPNHQTATDTAATLDLDFTTDVTRATLAWAVTLAPEPGSALGAAAACAALASLRRRRLTRGRRPSR